MKPSVIYRFLKTYCTIGLWFYFRYWNVVGKEKIPNKGPLIFIANHQNAFLDAILMTCSTNRNPFYLTRSDVFKKKWVAKILLVLHLKPIYRLRDGFNSLKNNEQALQECQRLLDNDEVILLFPEGNHNEPWSIQSFQKGFARIALSFQQKNYLQLKIIPLGIHYTHHSSFNGGVLLNVGNPIVVNEHISSIATERENLESLVKAGEEALKKLVLDLKPDSEYEKRYEHLLANRVVEDDGINQLESDKIVAKQFPNPTQKKSRKFTLQWLLYPIVAYVFITHGILFLIISSIVRKKIRDPQFISSIKFALGIFATPLYYVVITIVFYLIMQNLLATLLLFLSLPISLIIAKRCKK